MRRFVTILTLSAVLTVALLLPAGPVSGQVGREALAACKGMAFSTEEDFLSQGPEPPDGNPIISDGDLLGPGCVVCARNRDLLALWQIEMDLGLDAADVIDVEGYMVAFSTELDDPAGRFLSGDLLATNGAIIPNVALLFMVKQKFDLPPGDLGLDAVHFVGARDSIIRFLDHAAEAGRDYWLENPGGLSGMLEEYQIDIWFSTEGTALPVEKPAFLDGDLLSARDGIIIAANSVLLPPDVPAGIPERGVDFGLDGATCDRTGNREWIFFSTSILYEGKELSFTDGDILRLGDGVVRTNWDLIHCFEPKANFLGLDALSIAIGEPPPPCEAVIIQVGGMAAGSIGPNGLANGWSVTTPSFEAHDSPFGGWVKILGRMVSCDECVKFKVEYGEWPDLDTPPTTFYPLTDSFKEWVYVWPGLWVRVDRVPDGDGWLDILCNTVMGGLYYPWNTSGKDGKYSLKLTIEDAGGIQHESAPVVVMIDNTLPDAKLSFDVVPVCGDIFIGDVVTGKITGTDDHFYSYHLWYESSLASGSILPVRKYTGVTDTGDVDVPFAWDTTGLPPCGYRIVLEVWDRTIRNNHRTYGEPGFGWRRPRQAYFCLEEAPPE